MRRWGALVVASLGLFVSCSSNTAPQSAADSAVPAVTEAVPTSPPATEPPAPVTAAPTTAPAAATWEQVDAPSTCMCADGSPYRYWVHQGDPSKVVFFLQGGGACFDAASCSFSGGSYDTTVDDGDNPANHAAGIFELNNPANPLADYSFVFAPYCTGDIHLGTATHEYAPELTVHHNGAINATTALNTLAERFPDAQQVLVTGESAGAAATPLYAGLAHDLLPDAAITVLADGSGAYPDVPAINALIGGLWGTEAAIPPWPENAGLTAESWSLPGLFVQAHLHDPQMVFGRHDYAFDRVQTFFGGLAGFSADNLVQLIDGNETQIESEGVDLRSFIAPGNSHTVLGQEGFYTESVNGVALVDWVADLVRRAPQPDVHCTECTTG